MEEAHAGGGPGIVVKQPVEGVVADEGACGVGNGGTKPGGTDGCDQVFHRNCGKIGGGTVGGAGLALGEMTGIVPGGTDPGIPDVDGDPLRGHGIPPCGDTYAEDHIGPEGFRSGENGVRGQAKDGRELQFGQPVRADGIGEPGYRLPGRIDGCAGEGVEAGDEQMFHGGYLLSACPYYHKAVQKTRKCTKGSSNFCGRLV